MLSTFFASVRHWVQLVTYSWRVLGPRVIVRNLARLIADPGAGHVPSGFDARWGTDTESELTPAEARLPADRRTVATMYLPTLDEDLDAMLGALAWPESQLRQATFVDLGSGKARVVLLAAMRRFREVVGVELSPVLHAVAERNLALVAAAGALSSPVRLALEDATEHEVPRGPLVLYLYHPFPDAIAQRVLARVTASIEAAPRPVAILYGHPTLQRPIHPRVFAQNGLFAPVREGERRTRSFQVGWTIWTNEAWLGAASAPTVILEAVSG